MNTMIKQTRQLLLLTLTLALMLPGMAQSADKATLFARFDADTGQLHVRWLVAEWPDNDGFVLEADQGEGFVPLAGSPFKPLGEVGRVVLDYPEAIAAAYIGFLPGSEAEKANPGYLNRRFTQRELNVRFADSEVWPTIALWTLAHPEATGPLNMQATLAVNDTQRPLSLRLGFIPQGTSETVALAELKSVVPVRLTPPPAPRGMQADRDLIGVKLSWDARSAATGPAPAIGYHVYRGREGDPPETFEQVTEVPVFAVEFSGETGRAISAGFNYLDRPSASGAWAYYVRAVDPFGVEGAPSEIAVAEFNGGLAPAAPTGVRGRFSDGDALITWDAPETAVAGWKVFRGDTPTGPFTPLTSQPLSSSETEFTDEFVEIGDANYYAVSAIDAAGLHSQLSVAVRVFAPDGEGPGEVKGLIVTDDGASPLLDWVANSDDDLAGYVIWRAIGESGALRKINATPLMATTFRDPIAHGEAVTLRYAVQAIDLAGNAGPRSKVASLSYGDDPPPPAPVITQALPDSEGNIVISWTIAAPEDLSGFFVFRSTVADSPGEPLSAYPLPAAPMEFIDRGLNGGTLYHYRVQALDRGNNLGPVSAAGAARAVDLTPPPAPGGIEARQMGTRISLSFSSVSDRSLAGYRIYRASNPGGPWRVVELSTLQTTWIDGDTMPGDAWWYRVTALDNSLNESTPSATIRGEVR